MQTLAMASSRLLFLFCSIFLHLVALTIAQQDSRLKHICSSNEGNFTSNSTYQTNLNHLLSSFFNTKIDYGFYNASYGQNSDQVNAMALCRGDVKPDRCRSCINGSTLELTKLCPNQKEAFIWYDNCMLRYSDRFFFGDMEFGPWFWMYNMKNVSDANTFDQAVGTLLDSLKKEAASGDSRRKFATGNANTSNSQTIYALVQCTPDLSKQQCSDCLNNATSLIPQCCNGRIGGRVIAPSCNFRYEIDRFYDDTAAAPTTTPAPAPSTPPISQPPASPDESPGPAASPPPTSQPPASPDNSPPPSPSPPSCEPVSPNGPSPPPSSPLPQSPPPTPTNSANPKGKTSHFVLVLVPLLLSQYL